MCNIKFCYLNEWDSGTISYTTQHYSFPAENTQGRRLTNVWRSSYQENTGGGNFEITTSNQKLYFNEGAGTLTATINTGAFNAADLATEIKNKMDVAGAGTYTVTYDFDNLKFIIAIDTGTFELEGTGITNAIWGTIGFNTVDTGLAASHTADYIRIHTHEYIQISLTSLASFNALFIFNHNIQTSGTLKWQFSNNNFASIPLEISPTRNGNIAVELLSIIQSYDYIRIYISDINNPAGYVQVGRAWVGETFTPDIGYSSGGTENPEDKSVISESLSGESMSIQYPHIERRTYKFDIAEPYIGFKNMYDAIGKSKPMVIITRENTPDSISFDNPELYTLYCRMPNYTKNNIGGSRWRINITIKEEK